MTRAFWQYPISWGPLDQSGSGSGNPTTWAQAKLQLAIPEFYFLQYIVLGKIIVKNY
jgi:hypothetical protein